AAAGLTATLTKPVRASELFSWLVGGVVMTESPLVVAAAPGTRPSRRGRVLLVEDNPTNQLVATRMLAKLGYDVDVAYNGAEAVAVSATQRYAVIHLACQMPGMAG